ncbi:MAG: hypothetical protein U5L45_11830 [Saprospiraceae bacterium]|nr:hypothetical protein [Saprospiraceae bacterium]
MQPLILALETRKEALKLKYHKANVDAEKSDEKNADKDREKAEREALDAQFKQDFQKLLTAEQKVTWTTKEKKKQAEKVKREQEKKKSRKNRKIKKWGIKNQNHQKRKKNVNAWLSKSLIINYLGKDIKISLNTEGY